MDRREILKLLSLYFPGSAVFSGESFSSQNTQTTPIPYAEVKQQNGAPTLFIDGKPALYSGMWVTTPSPEHWGHAPESWPHPHDGNSDTAQRTSRTGIHIYAFGVGHEWSGPGEGYKGHFNFSGVKKSFQRIIDSDPLARLHLRINLENQGWWRKVYPDECEITSEGRQPVPSYASKIWREEAIEFLKAYIAHIRNIGMADLVIAYQVMAGETGEWTRFSSSGAAPCGDFSEPMKQCFHSYLRSKYHDNVSELRSAWNNSGMTFDTAEVPSDKEQLETKHFAFRDPSKEQNVIDYFMCLADLCSGLVVDYCKTVKDATENMALAGAFYGYTMTCAYNEVFYNQGIHEPTEFSHYQRGGHLGFKKVLDSPYVDFVVSPISYGFRGIGGDAPGAFLEDSVSLHGKLLIIEEDSRLHDTPFHTTYGRANNLNESVAILRRNFSRAVIRGQGMWRAPAGDPALYPLLSKFNRIGEFSLLTDHSPCAEVAVLIDEESILYESVKYYLDLANLSHQTLQGLARFGAPYDLYHLDDFIEGRVSPHKMYIFLNPFRLDNTRREKLNKEIRKDGRVAVWIYAPGYIKDTCAIENMTEVTGMLFEKSELPWPAFMHILDFTHPVTVDIPQDLFWNYSSALGSLFSLKDPEVHVLGNVVYSQGSCVPGMGIRQFPEWTSVYIAVPNVPAPLLRGLARFAGVHLYNDRGDVLYASRNLLGVHTISGGLRNLKLPWQVEIIYDLFNKRDLDYNTDNFEIKLSPVSSELYYTGEKEKLLNFIKT